MNDALSVVAQLRDLASEPQNREAIVQDQGCLPGLVLFLDVQDEDVLFAALQVRPRRPDSILKDWTTGLLKGRAARLGGKYGPIWQPC